MPAAWPHSMNGVPWTAAKMRQAVKVLKPGGAVTFAFGTEPLERLFELDAKVLARRPDLVLHGWGAMRTGRMTTEELDALASLPHLRNLKLTSIRKASFAALGRLHALESLSLHADRIALQFLETMPALRSVAVGGLIDDLSPLASCKRLTELRLARKFGDLAPLAKCTRLTSLALEGGTVRSIAFLPKLPRLARLRIDSCTIAGSLAPIASAPKLTSLSLTSPKALTSVDFLADATKLESLSISLSNVIRLPSLAKLTRLDEVLAKYMKVWTNPDAFDGLPRLRSIGLWEVNPKIPAEQFFFLADSKKLKKLAEVDIRFLDYGKRRRPAIVAHFAAVGRSDLLVLK